MQKPKVSSTLQVKVDARQNNGEDTAAAIVTKVVESEDGNDYTVNLLVFMDTGATQSWKDVSLVEKKDLDDAQAENPQGRVAFWAPR